MSEAASRRAVLHVSAMELVFDWFLRIVAAYCLLFGTLYWVRLISLYPGPLWRFDLMPAHWQVAAVSLAVLFPFAAAGLWMLTSWGPVIWFICAVTEAVMYAGFPQMFGHRPLILFMHGAVALIYIALRAVIHIQGRRAQR